MTKFALDPRLEASTLEVSALPLCLVRLMNDRRFPWVILVPARPDVVEIDDLAPPDRAILIEEIAQVSAALREELRPAKINVGALGNIVTQLHVHVVARFTSDDAWPGPVWGTKAERYRVDEIERKLAPLRYRLGGGA
jgi:diadenosine tetraphosphate (Ap4A) HIT family hydrolase